MQRARSFYKRLFKSEQTAIPASKAVILVYHRVTNLSLDPFKMAVSPGNFQQQMDYLNQTCQVMRLNSFLEALKTASLPQRAVAVTFDDGYFDNLAEALPILEAARVPATAFITSLNIGRSTAAWWDVLGDIMFRSAEFPECIRLTVNGQTYSWPIQDTQQRKRTHQSIYTLFQLLNPDAREQALEDLESWLGHSSIDSESDLSYRWMSTAELVTFSDSPYIDLGGHTLNHPYLSSLSLEAQYAEIVGNMQWLESIIHRPVTVFSYPYGNYSPATPQIVKSVGFQAAVTTKSGCITLEDDPYQLKRCGVYNWDLEQFQRNLEAYFLE